MNLIRPFETINDTDRESVGGKGLSLGLMTRAGLPVPSGFCITSEAYRRAHPEAQDVELQEEISEAYRRLGAGRVAVRSSATFEDGEVASFAGQQETILGVEGEAAVVDAVRRCWQSLDSDRARAYRRKQNVDEAAAMAVVVQRLVPSEVSGVLFTRDPLDPEARRMLVEAAWGLGESVVSGRVTPDRYHLDKQTGSLLEQTIGHKSTTLTPVGPQAVPPEKHDVPCLQPEQLKELAKFGNRIEALYGGPRDVEWAWAEGRFWILQARPITTAGAFEREQVRCEEIVALRAKASPRGTVWAKYNLAEVLPCPTPMTWAIVRRFMSGRGGYGLMFRDLGFDPDPMLDQEGFLDLVCGRPYVNLSREPKLYFRHMPLSHSFATLKAHPERALYPQPTPDPEGVTAGFLFRLPVVVYRMLRNHSRLKRQSRYFGDYLRREAFPRFAPEVEAERQVDLQQLETTELLTRLHHWIDRTLNDFARDSLRPSVFAGQAIGTLEQGLKKHLEAEHAAAAVRRLLQGVHPDPEADLPAALHALQRGHLTEDVFLQRFGHRGPQEMELAQPRWAEAPELLHQARSKGVPSPALPLLEHTKPEERWQALVEETKLHAKRARSLEPLFRHALTYSALRETAKHYLMMGYALIRRILLELDRRHALSSGIFFLVPEELPGLINGEDFRTTIQQRRARRALALSLDVPTVLFSDDLEAIGRPTPVADSEEVRGTPVSAGVAEAPALVLEEPTAAADDLDEFVLVCPSTDPAWVPLFLKAKALVMETGGVLSHGAIVAREFGLPAVVGIPQATKRFHTGQRLRVDGNTGSVYVRAD